jgi:hypothetical protein
MQWDPNDVVDSRVDSSSEWWIDLKDYETLEAKAGVYLLANAKYDIKYIGTAGAGKMIQEIKDAINRKNSKGATKIRALYTKSKAKAQSLEKYLTKKYNPVNNRT